MEPNPDTGWRQKRWPIPLGMLAMIQLRLCRDVKHPGTSAARRTRNLKLLAKFRELGRER